jgi:hypothetical protein
MTQLQTPETELSYGAQSITVLTTKPAGLDTTGVVTAAEATAGANISLHVVGSWFPTADTERANTARKAGSKKTVQVLGTSTVALPDLMVTHLAQEADSADGNEAREALPEDAIRYVLLRNGVDGDLPVAAGDRGKVYPIKVGRPMETQTQDDAGGEEALIVPVGFAPGYDGPVDVTIS